MKTLKDFVSIVKVKEIEEDESVEEEDEFRFAYRILIIPQEDWKRLVGEHDYKFDYVANSYTNQT